MDDLDLFSAALELGTLEEREEFLREACGDNPALRERIEALLRSSGKASRFIESPALATEKFPTFDLPISEQPGAQIGPYKLLQQIGEGGMGVVYMAEQTVPLERTVALKIIKPGMDTRQVIARFEAERQALSMMDHPNIARVLDAGTTDTGRPYFVMDLVKGVPITDYCDQQHLPVRCRLELLMQVCQAVQHAHHKGIIHRDIKPNNVLVAEYDNHAIPKVIDFGVAKATASKLTEKTMFTEFGQLVGTVEYMSPEQAKLNQLDVDTRSDIYSLGVLMYELLTGSTPFEAKRLHAAAFDEMLRIVREEEPPNPSTRLSTTDQLPSIAANRGSEPKNLGGTVKGELDWVVMKCLAKDRNARYGSPNDLADDLRSWLHGEPMSVRAAGLVSLLRLWLRQNFDSSGWAIALGVIWGIVGGVVCWLVMLNPLDLSVGLRRVIYLLGASIVGSGGLITVWLLRPKDISAELAGGAITGVVAAVVCYTISWGWVAVSIAGVPYGIWLGMVIAILLMVLTCIAETLAAGMLLRRHGQLRSIAGPYLELITPSILAVIFASSALFRISTVGLGERFWHPIMIPLLVLAAIGVLARWPWYVRALLHFAWVGSLIAFATGYGGK